MSDDELRRRLRDMPAPSARLDADAAIAAAKRRRRPKTIALSSAATIAGVLIVAPLAVTGLQGFGPGGIASTSSDGGAQPESGGDSGAESAAPASAAPEAAPEAGSESSEESATDAGADDTGAAGESSEGPWLDSEACLARSAGDVGLALRFLDDPSDGTAALEIRNVSSTAIAVRLIGAGSATLGDDGGALDAGVAAGAPTLIELGAGGAHMTAVELGPRTACPLDASAAPGVDAGDGAAAPGIAPLATVDIVRGQGGDAERLTVVGAPFDVR